MEFRQLGRSGLRVSEIAYGNWLTHGSQIEADQARDCVHAALDVGITTFDTADTYANGKAEAVLGEILRGERREGLEILTKCYFPTGPGREGGTLGANDHGLSRKHIRESLHASLRRLQTDYVDVYQAHRYDTLTPLEETMEAYADLVHQGKVLYVGVSEWRAEWIQQAHALARELRIQLVSNQPQYNMIHRVIEPEVMPACEALGVSQIVWSPLLQGVLTGKYVAGGELPAGSRATDESYGGATMMDGLLGDELLERVALLRPVAEDCGLTMAQLAIAWLLQHDNVASAIVGATRPEQLTETVAASGVHLGADVMRRVDEALEPVVNRDPEQTQAPDRKEF